MSPQDEPPGWAIDTSAWALRDRPPVKRTLIAEIDAGHDLYLTPPVLVELLRTPTGEQGVTALARELASAMAVIPFGEETSALLAVAMQRLASYASDAHRVPVPDLLTAVCAHQHGLGVLHLDAHFDTIASGAGLSLISRWACDPRDLGLSAEQNAAAEQRRLRKRLNRSLAQLPVERAESLLRDFCGSAERERQIS